MILSEYGLLVKHFEYQKMILSMGLNPQNYKNIEAVVDVNHKFEKCGKQWKQFRCTNCRETLSRITFVCKHKPSCKKRKDISDSSKLDHSLMSETLSSIDKASESEKTNSSFLSISKEELKIQTNIQKNTSYSQFTQDSSHTEKEDSNTIDSKK